MEGTEGRGKGRGLEMGPSPVERTRDLYRGLKAVHCKPGPLDKQFCMANTAIFTSYITLQSNHNEIFHSRQM
jgi:hypothetical protein